MAAFILKLDTSLITLFDESVYTQVRLAAYPTTLPLAQDFDGVLSQWTSVRDQETTIERELVSAHATTQIADDDLDDLSDEMAKTLLLLCKGNRADPEYQLYFGERRPSDVKRPFLGAQLETMRGWLQLTPTSSHPQIVALGQRIAAAVARADAALVQVTAAEQKNRAFRATGPRRQLVDAINAVRKSTYGKLAEMPHAQPQLKLPADFAERFFRARAGNGQKARSESDVEEMLASARRQVVDLEAELDSMKKATADEQAAEAKAAKSAAQQELAEAEKQMAAMAAKVAELKAKAGG